MFTPRNIARCRLATMWPAILALIVALAAGIDLAGKCAAAPQEAGDVATEADRAAYLAAFATAREWVSTYAPPSVESPDAVLPLPDCQGVCVVLRRSGKVVSTGIDTEGGPLMVRRAIGRALNDALGHPIIAGLPDDMKNTVGTMLTMQMEFAGKLKPLTGRTLAHMTELLEPGLDGLAVRKGGKVAARFPAEMLATNTAGDLERSMLGLAASMNIPLKHLDTPSALSDVAFYSFRCTSLAQAEPGDQPFNALRYARAGAPVDVSPLGIAAFANGLATHIERGLWAGQEPLGLGGSYRPLTGERVPVVAPPLEQALGAWALAKYAACINDALANRPAAREAAARILRDLAGVDVVEEQPVDDPAACAAIVLASLELGRDPQPEWADLFEQAQQRLIDFTKPDAGSGSQPGATSRPARQSSSKSLPPHTQAMLCAALARLRMVHPGSSIDQAALRSAIDAAWSSVPPHQAVALLPWIGWAEADVALEAQQDIPDAKRLASLLRVIEQAQARAGSVPGLVQVAEDCVGGYALHAGGGPAALTLPTSQTARPAAWIPSTIEIEALTPAGERAERVDHVKRSLAFLMRLAVGESSRGLIPNVERAAGGVREAPWSMEQPLAAQAMTLAAAIEALEALTAEPNAGLQENGPVR